MALLDRIMNRAPGNIPKATAGPMEEIGVSGLKAYGGYIKEEYLSELDGQRGRDVFKQMAESDATVAAILHAIEQLLRAVDWKAEPADDTPEAEELAEFASSLMDDLSTSWEDFIAEVLTMLRYGWSYFEVVLKRRVGPDERDPRRRSKYTDGRMGIRKLAPRSQDTLDRWELQEDGGIAGMWQYPLGTYAASGSRFLPIDRCLLFRTTSNKNNPEGRSLLRRAYRSWYFLTGIQDVEAIGIERELAGLPVVRIPSAVLTGTDAESVAQRTAYEQVARDLKNNSQGGLVIPSDTYKDNDGKLSQVAKVDVTLLTTGGQRAIDTTIVKRGYQTDIAMSVLADFLMLGREKAGSYALSENKSSLFVRSIEALADSISSVLNRFMLPRIWKLNDLNRDRMPRYRTGDIAPVNLEQLGAYIRDISTAGAILPDTELESHLRAQAGLPEMSGSEDLEDTPGGQRRPRGPVMPGAPDDDEGGQDAARRRAGANRPAGPQKDE